MEENDLKISKIEKRHAEVAEARARENALIENMTEDELVEHLLNQYKQNKQVAKELGLKTISEDDING